MNWKIITGLLLMLPLFVALGYCVLFQFGNPEMTHTQIFNAIGFWPYLTMVPGLGGFILYCAGREDYESPDA